MTCPPTLVLGRMPANMQAGKHANIGKRLVRLCVVPRFSHYACTSATGISRLTHLKARRYNDAGPESGPVRLDSLRRAHLRLEERPLAQANLPA
jgi:hypothetical protein